MYVSVFTVPNDMGLDHWQLIHVAPGKSVTVTSARDNTEARAIFFFACPPLDYDHRDIGQQQELLEAAFAGQGWEIPRLLAAMRDAPGFYFDSVSQIRMDNWSAGRVALVGDAGYRVQRVRGHDLAFRSIWPSTTAAIGTSFVFLRPRPARRPPRRRRPGRPGPRAAAPGSRQRLSRPGSPCRPA